MYVRRRRMLVAGAALIVANLAACGARTTASTLNGLGFAMTVSPGWTASHPSSQEGGTMYQIAGPNNSGIAIVVWPTTASLGSGIDLAQADLGTLLLTVVGTQTGSTLLDISGLTGTMLGGGPAMEFNATLLGHDGVKTQSEAIDARYRTNIYFILIGSPVGDYARAEAAGRAMLATWHWSDATTAGTTTTSPSPPSSTSAPATASALPAPTRPPSLASGSFSFTSEPGDFIGQGKTEQFASPSDSFGLNALFAGDGGDTTPTTSGFRISIHAGDGEGWSVMIAPPQGQTLHVGSYGDASRNFADGGAAIDVTGDGRGCNQSFSSFDIHQLVSDNNGVVSSVDVSFTQRCEVASAPTLTGRVQASATG